MTFSLPPTHTHTHTHNIIHLHVCLHYSNVHIKAFSLHLYSHIYVYLYSSSNEPICFTCTYTVHVCIHVHPCMVGTTLCHCISLVPGHSHVFNVALSLHDIAPFHLSIFRSVIKKLGSKVTAKKSTKLPERIKEEGDDQPKELPFDLWSSCLQSLYLQSNQLRWLPDYLGKFAALTRLDISG